MAQDFAKRRRPPAAGKVPARKKPSRASAARHADDPGGGWRWYAAGVLTGLFLSLLVYLGTLPGTGGVTGETRPETPAKAPPRPRFDFYTLLPEQTIEVEVAPASATRPTTAGGELYLLQAGSFRQREDADRRRAELLLLGLDPRVEEASGDNGRWFRVYIGPFNSRSKMARARALTAEQDIDTLLLKRGSP